MRHRLLFILALLFSASTIHAQTWQWGKRGGSQWDASSGTNMWEYEQVYDMASDRNGNVYFVSVIINDGPTLGSYPVSSYMQLPTYGNTAYAHSNLLLASYNCNGILRWKKVIGGDASVTATSLRTDTFGHVYLMGTATVVQSNSNQPVRMHFDADTTLPYDLLKSMFIAQYDTSGNYKWLRMPDPDTLTYYGSFPRSGGYDLGVDAAGNLSVLAWLGTGSLPNTPYTVSSPGLFVIKYSPQGSVLSAIHPPGMNITTVSGMGSSYDGFPTVGFNNFRIAPAPNGNWTIAGVMYQADPGFSINGVPVAHEGFTATFNSQWQHVWHYLPDTNTTWFMGRPAVDAASNVYFTGGIWGGQMLFGDTIHSNPMLGEMPFIAKVNAAGQKQWITSASSNTIGTGGCYAFARGEDITYTNGGEVAITGGCGGLKWGNYQINGVCNYGYGVFLARASAATGIMTGLDTIPRSSGAGNFGTGIANAKGNSLYIGGKLASAQYAGSDTMIYAGGYSDFFITKWGYPCNCTAVPAASFTSVTTAAKTLQFTYTGTTTAIDSIVWNFGDGQKQKIINNYTSPLSHTYATNGHYTASVTVYSSCGTNTTSKAYALSISSTNALTGVSVYPNPATNILTVDGLNRGGKATILSIVGQQVMSATLNGNNQQINISALPAGTYILVLSDNTGSTSALRFIKE